MLPPHGDFCVCPQIPQSLVVISRTDMVEWPSAALGARTKCPLRSILHGVHFCSQGETCCGPICADPILSQSSAPMATGSRSTSHSPPPPVRNQWLADRVESLRSELGPAAAAFLRVTRSPDAANLRPLPSSFPPLLAQPSDGPGRSEPAQKSGGGGFSGKADGPNEREPATGEDGTPTPLSYLERLSASSFFWAPDCGSVLSSVMGVADEVHGLEGTIASGRRTDRARAADLRSRIIGGANCAWAEVAVRRGVRLAKSGGTWKPGPRRRVLHPLAPSGWTVGAG